jgi:hypothetical protein
MHRTGEGRAARRDRNARHSTAAGRPWAPRSALACGVQARGRPALGSRSHAVHSCDSLRTVHRDIGSGSMPCSAAQCVGWRRHGLAPCFIACLGSVSPRVATLVAVVVSPHVCRSPVALPAARALPWRRGDSALPRVGSSSWMLVHRSLFRHAGCPACLGPRRPVAEAAVRPVGGVVEARARDQNARLSQGRQPGKRRSRGRAGRRAACR